MDRAARKIIVENDGKHPASLISLLYLPKVKGGRGLRTRVKDHLNQIATEIVSEFGPDCGRS